MSKFPRFFVALNPMAEPGTDYIYHSQEPRFLAKKVHNNPLTTFDIVDDIDDIAAFYGGDAKKISALMSRLGDWYVSYLKAKK